MFACEFTDFMDKEQHIIYCQLSEIMREVPYAEDALDREFLHLKFERARGRLEELYTIRAKYESIQQIY